MKLDGLFDNTFKTLQRSLDVRARKHEVILSNVANADTPNYKAFEVIVEEELSKPGTTSGNSDLYITNPLHISDGNDGGANIHLKKVEISDSVTLRGDGNTVNMEKEMAELSENNLMYRATTQLLQKKFSWLLKAVQGGKR